MTMAEEVDMMHLHEKTVEWELASKRYAGLARKDSYAMELATALVSDSCENRTGLEGSGDVVGVDACSAVAMGPQKSAAY